MSSELSRLAKMIVDAEAITQAEAEARLQAMTLEIVVGEGAENAAAQNAILTALVVGQRTFAGGVSVELSHDAEFHSALPLGVSRLSQAISALGAQSIESSPTARIVVGDIGAGAQADAYAWWEGWTAGSSAHRLNCDSGENPLAGVVAGAACVARAFAKVSKRVYPSVSAYDLWPHIEGHAPPSFNSVFLPGAIWLLGLGNLGQAIMWSLSSLPFPNPETVELVTQDRDKISRENWGTSILVQPETYGAYKTAVAEAWALKKGFNVRRVDRWLDARQRVDHGEPLLAISSFDSVDARKHIDSAGFEVIIDAGLGRRHSDFDTYRVTIFDRDYRVASHFAEGAAPASAPPQDYEELLGLDKCGAAVFDGIAVAAPFVSAIAGAIAVARAIAISSGAGVPRTETRRLWSEARRSASVSVSGRGLVRFSANRAN